MMKSYNFIILSELYCCNGKKKQRKITISISHLVRINALNLCLLGERTTYWKRKEKEKIGREGKREEVFMESL